MKSKEVKTESKSLHTSGVWTFTNQNHSEFLDIDGDSRICSIDVNEDTLREQGMTKEEAIANAEIICKAVNAHDDLVKALQNCIGELNCYILSKETNPVLLSAKEALKKATV